MFPQGNTWFLVTLTGSMDDLPVALFDTRAGVEAFLTENQPAPVDGRDAIRVGPLAEAMNVAGVGPSQVLGYKVWTFTDGRPVAVENRRWLDEWPGPAEYGRLTLAERNALHAEETNEPWDAPQEEWDG
jgi:hypothetical protein